MPEKETRKNSAVLFVPPFAEEMNKSRRMMAEQGRRLASQGNYVLFVDLFGTGDSEGDFADAAWDVWVEDLKNCLLRMESLGFSEISIITLRSGALLSADLIVQSSTHIKNLILWQPVINGDAYLTQFLRLKLAADMARESGSKVSVKDLKKQLVDGESVEVAGYLLPPASANGLASKKLVDIMANNPRFSNTKIVWMNILSDLSREIPAASRKVIEHLIESKLDVQVEKVVGVSFWMSAEIEEIETLLCLTSQIFQETDDA